MKLDREFYTRDTLTVAKELLGKILVHETPQGTVKGKIIEVEAYLGKNDAAAHSYKAKPFGRTNVMYLEGGYAYVYFIYGMYYCFNVVTNLKDIPEAVLVRAVWPLEGIELMQQRRKTDNIKKLCSGPGKLCLAFNIDKSCYGLDLCGDTLYIEDAKISENEEIISTKRINIDYAGEAANYPYRFILQKKQD